MENNTLIKKILLHIESTIRPNELLIEGVNDMALEYLYFFPEDEYSMAMKQIVSANNNLKFRPYQLAKSWDSIAQQIKNITEKIQQSSAEIITVSSEPQSEEQSQTSDTPEKTVDAKEEMLEQPKKPTRRKKTV